MWPFAVDWGMGVITFKHLFKYPFLVSLHKFTKISTLCWKLVLTHAWLVSLFTGFIHTDKWWFWYSNPRPCACWYLSCHRKPDHLRRVHCLLLHDCHHHQLIFFLTPFNSFSPRTIYICYIWYVPHYLPTPRALPKTWPLTALLLSYGGSKRDLHWQINLQIPYSRLVKAQHNVNVMFIVWSDCFVVLDMWHNDVECRDPWWHMHLHYGWIQSLQIWYKTNRTCKI